MPHTEVLPSGALLGRKFVVAWSKRASACPDERSQCRLTNTHTVGKYSVATHLGQLCDDKSPIAFFGAHG